MRKYILAILAAAAFFLQSCGQEERENKLRDREIAVAEKEKQLDNKEQELAILSNELMLREQHLDSTEVFLDSVNIYDTAIVGKWQVKMACTETTCEGSAIGDTKTEQWEITYNRDAITAKAFSGKNLVRIYNGFYKKAGGIQLVDDNNILVVLNPTSEKKMEGTRTITQENCKIIYSLSADKQ